MVTASPSRSHLPAPAWHQKFIEMLPAIVLRAQVSFRNCDPDRREDLIQEVVCNACQAVARLAELGKLDLAYASVLARYAVSQVREGRKVGCKQNIRDVMSPYCQREKNLTVARLDHYSDDENKWKEAVVQDTRTAPVCDVVAFRCDFADWLKHLSRRDRKIAESLALGNRTSDVAKRFKICDGRVSQLRRELAESWHTFVGDEPDDASAVPA